MHRPPLTLSVAVRPLPVSLRGPGQSPVLLFAQCVGSLLFSRPWGWCVLYLLRASGGPIVGLLGLWLGLRGSLLCAQGPVSGTPVVPTDHPAPNRPPSGFETKTLGAKGAPKFLVPCSTG